MSSKEQILEKLHQPPYRRIFEKIRERFEAAGPTAKSVVIEELNETELHTLASLQGLATTPRLPVRVSFKKLDQILQASTLQASLVEVLEAMGPPLVDRRRARRERKEATDQVWKNLFLHSAVRRYQPLETWLISLKQSGRATRIAQSNAVEIEAVLLSALNVLARLPTEQVPLSVLSAEITGDAHALDFDQPTGKLVLSGLAHLSGIRFADSTSAKRSLWTTWGVLCDPLSADVLVLRLRPIGSDLLSRHLREAADSGEPRRVTLREIAKSELRVPEGTPVFVCENPAIVAAAADRLSNGHALVCVDGMPSAAAVELLKQLASSGAKVHFRADFDWGGIRIGNILARHSEGHPWRFKSEDYERAIGDVEASIRLKGEPIGATWDSNLRDVMKKSDRAVFEEQLWSALLNDVSVPSE